MKYQYDVHICYYSAYIAYVCNGYYCIPYYSRTLYTAMTSLSDLLVPHYVALALFRAPVAMEHRALVEQRVPPLPRSYLPLPTIGVR